MTVMPRAGEEWTVDDLDRIPDDGLQYELLDGLLLDRREPSVLALDLVDGRYVTVGEAGGATGVALRRPFPVEVVPGDLVRPPA